ncbi:MAG: T9SS type A sorting domain-containing protein [Bacteroidales bacterium]|nr:T9SS type A sorting domain-containing protein [Bacteroidales bacterium]MCF8388624.1 T9SS type A sorting domain-containing protein [Bacteroidales bacterium]MCF8399366.1 T9SS type A sorting domain-containing protein [Bacteroidales bacterium]
MRNVYNIIIFLLWFSNVSAQVIPVERRVDWSVAGYPGNIPHPELIINAVDFGANGDSLTDNATALNDAISFLAGNRGVISFPPGTFLFRSGINLTDSVIIRGASSDETHFVFDLGGAAENCFNIDHGQSVDFTTLVAGFEKGSGYIVVTDPSLFEANAWAELRQSNGSWDTEPISWADHSVGQIIYIKAISTDTLMIQNPLRFNYDPGLNPEVRPIETAHETGLECFKITRADNALQGVGYNFYFAFATNCWIRGVESSKSIGSHIYLTQCSGVEITGSYIHDAFAYNGSGTRGYGITLNKHSGECLVENNILKHLRHALMIKTGANGNVFAYNYSIEPYRSEPIHDFSGDISLHGHFAFANLFEGNIVQNIIIDHYWGPSGPWNTMFRNRPELYGIFMTSSDTTETGMQNFVGNEITNPIGFYLLTGEDHFEYGNNFKGTILPEGTGDLPDTSYYRSDIPAFWDITDPWPPIGPPNDTGEYSIPARERYLKGWTKTVCSDTLYTVKNTWEYEHSIELFPNPSTGIVYLKSRKKIGKVLIYNIQGRLLREFDQTPSKIVLEDHLTDGLYLIRFLSDKHVHTQKLLLKR